MHMRKALQSIFRFAPAIDQHRLLEIVFVDVLIRVKPSQIEDCALADAKPQEFQDPAISPNQRLVLTWNQLDLSLELELELLQ